MKNGEFRKKKDEAGRWFNADEWAVGKPQGSGSLSAGSGQFGNW